MVLIRLLKALLLLALVGGVAYAYREPLERVILQAYAKVFPCNAPIQYTIGDIDGRFGMSRSEFLFVLNMAEEVWEKPSGRDLFVYSVSGASMPVHFIYDQRQATTAKLRELDVAVDRSVASYNKIRAEYEALRAEYLRERAAFVVEASDFESAQAAHAREVRDWNARGGAPEAEYKKLQAQKAMLEAQLAALKQKEVALNALADDVNEMVGALNKMARDLNLDVAQYNTVGRALPDEFEEGLYTESFGERHIEIYEFGSREKLIRVLAHEFGHALGLEHVDEEGAIMYPLNRGTSVKAAAGDIAALKARCGVE